MHYIIGTTISVNTSKVNPRDPKTYRTRKPPSDFKPGLEYSLYHIRKDDEGKMRYVFISNDQTDVVGLKFDTITEADKHIALIKGDQIPNYSEIYSRNTT